MILSPLWYKIALDILYNVPTLLLEFDKWYHSEICLSCFSGLVTVTVWGLQTNSSRMFSFSFMIAIRRRQIFMFLCLPGLFLFLRKASICYLYHVGMPMEKNCISSLCPSGCCPESHLLIFTQLRARRCCTSSQFSVLRQHEVVLTVFLFPMSLAEIKTRDWQFFLLLVVQLETTRSRGTWFRFTVFLRLTQTICSGNFGICLRIRDLPRYSPDSQINSLGFKTNSENSAQQWQAVQFFRLFLQFVKGTTDRLLEKKSKMPIKEVAN